MMCKDKAPAWSIRLAFELSANDQTAQALIAGLTDEQLNWQPAPGSWNVGQCLEHLSTTNQTYMPTISAALIEKLDSPVEQITPVRFARWFIRSFAEPSPNTKRASAPRKIRPPARVDLSVLDRFLSGNKSCRELQKVECFAAANLPKHDAVWAVPQSGFQKVANGDCRNSVLLPAGFKPD